MRAIASLLGLGFLAMGAQAAHAEDERAAFVTKLFMDVCIPNMGKPDGVRAWAVARNLTPAPAGPALDLFVGEAPPGATREAWAIPTTIGKFALSIRGTSRACAVWAQAADPVEVSDHFRKIVEGARRPGLEVTRERDETVGVAHVLIYRVKPEGALIGYTFTLLSTDVEGRGFQASIQLAPTQFETPSSRPPS